jgi:pimeloyl-ACP methyl ester carboxylesterase
VILEEQTLEAIRQATARWVEGTLEERLIHHHGENAQGAFHGWSDSWLHPDFSLVHLADQLTTIAKPLLVIQGRDDQYATMKQLDVIHRHVHAPLQCVVLENCRHFPHQDATQKTLQLIARFVEGLET